MSALTITVRHRRGDREVRAVRTPVPGLVIHEDAELAGLWAVTHESSGYGVAEMPDPEGALWAALQLAGMADWTRPGGDLFRDAAVKAAWASWAAEHCPEILRHPSGRGRGL